MTAARTAPGLTVDVHLPPHFAADALRRDAAAGLTAVPKSVPPRWLYDARGSELFEQITKIPEYYPTRAEREILEQSAPAIALAAGSDTLVELGSGSSIKTRLLIDAMRRAGGLDGYVALDVSEDALREAGTGLVADYPDLRVHALVADFTDQLQVLPRGGRRLVAFLGGTIGNFEPDQRAAFLADLRSTLDAGDRFLLGADLVKSPDVLVAAYDDPAGVTAAFTRNLLDVLNAGLDADFDTTRFEHVARWDPEQEWMDLGLRAVGAQTVRVGALDLDVAFADGEVLRTEVSAKFRRAGLRAELTAAGFAPDGWWTDFEGRFSLSLWRPVRTVDRG